MNPTQRVAIYVDAEQGHVLSSLGVAAELRRRGHKVTYLSLEAAKGLVQAHGFDFISVHEGEYPLGARSVEGLEVLQGPVLFRRLLSGDALDVIVSTLKPTVFITLSLFCLEAVVLRYRYNIPVVLFQPTWLFGNRGDLYRQLVMGRLVNLRAHAAEFLRLVVDRVPVSNFNDIAELLLLMPELVLFPREFSEPTDGPDPLAHFIGPGVDINRAEAPFRWESIDCNRPLAYCAFGSQPYLKNDLSMRLLEIVLESFVSSPTYQLILAAGEGLASCKWASRPNVYVTDWAPQMEILRHADLMITHGGSGTVKECIASGVPMIVIPLMRDQFVGGAKVVKQQIGIQLDSSSLSVDMLQQAVRRILGDRQFKDRVLVMREWFAASDLAFAAEIVEQTAGGIPGTWLGNSHRSVVKA